MSNPYYNHNDGVPAPQSRGVSATMRAEFDLIDAGFAKLPALATLYTGGMNYAVDTGTINAIAITVSANVTAHADGEGFVVKLLNSLTGATTVTITGATTLAAKSVFRADGSAIQANDGVAGQFLYIRYNVTTGAYQIEQNPSQTGVAGLPTTGGTMTGQIKFAKGAATAAAGTVNIDAIAGQDFHLTGNTTITAFTIAAGSLVKVIVDGTPLITYNATSLKVPGAANIQAAAGDTFWIMGDGSGNSIITDYTKANGLPTVIAALVGLPYLNVREQQASGTAGGALVGSDITQVRVLNTVVTNGITGASLSSNAITLPIGTYQVRARSPVYGGSTAYKAFLYNSTDSTYAIVGSSTVAQGTVQTDSLVSGQFAIAGIKNFVIRYYSANSLTVNGLGFPASSGQIEVYTEVEIWKVA